MSYNHAPTVYMVQRIKLHITTIHSMDNIFNIQKCKTDWKSENSADKALIAKAKTKREVLAKTIIHAKTIGSSRINIYDKEGNVSEIRTIKKGARKD